MPIDALGLWPEWTWYAIVAAAIFAAVVHGAIGFGFPLISTPLVALITDVRTAVLTTLIPNLVLNVISVVRGANWVATLQQYWRVAAYVLLGTIVGTWVLSFADTRVLKLLLSGLIIVHLLQTRIRGVDWTRLQRFPRLSPLVFGSLGGFFAGTVNVTVPPLLIYFSSLELAPVVMTQALNLSFLVGRSTQALALAASGQLGSPIVMLSLPLCLIAVLALWVGFRLQRRIRPETFNRLLRIVLWTMAATLAGQAGSGYLS
ncbi:conserved membrane hypothetical protein [Burkholderiales bacterium]|nr:conserved membrane hypothetical protein [Burkholderiales bacterium]